MSTLAHRVLVLVGFVLVAAVLTAGSGVGSVGLMSVSAATSLGSGLKAPVDPVVDVPRGSPGSAKKLAQTPSWKPSPVKAVPVGSARATAGKTFAAAGALPVSVADAATGQVVIAAATKSADAALTSKERAAALDASQAAAEPDEVISAPDIRSLWRKAMEAAPGLVPGGHNKGNAEVKRMAYDGPAHARTTAQPGTESATASAAEAAPVDAGASVAVTTLPAATVAKVGGRSIGFTVARKEPGSGPVAVKVDYASVVDAFGGDYGSRLRLVSYPACSVTTPAVASCRVGTVLTGVNDPKTQTMTALLTPDAADGAVAAPSASASPSPAPAAPSPRSSASASVSPSAKVVPSAKPSPRTSASPKASASAEDDDPAEASTTVAPALASGSASIALAGASASKVQARADLARAPPVARSASTVKTTASSSSSSASGAVVVATAAASSSFGAYTATPLQASGSWAVGTQAGDFSYEYPLPAVPGPAGGTPELSLGYSTSSVDDMVAKQNPQSSNIGSGWSLDVPFIERQYAPCTTTGLIGNTCWGVDAPTLSWSGHSGPLVHKGVITGTQNDLFQMTEDEGWLVERRREGNTLNPNGDADGEYWLLTDPEGTQYWFGRENTAFGADATNSTLTKPIYGQNAGETCYPQPGHKCEKAWRWNLAYVVDADRNVTRYMWDKQRAAYAVSGTAPAQAYDVTGELRVVEYGLTLANAASAVPPARVNLSYAWRCTQTTCAGPWTDPASWYPDVPFDLWCQDGSTTCPSGPTSPVHFSLRRLDSVSSQKWTGSGWTYTNVDQVKLTQAYPVSGAGVSPGLFLNTIVHTGYNGGTAAVPDLSFAPTFLANRWQPNTALGETALERPRIGSISNEFGGVTTVTYGQPSACSVVPPAADTQTTNCFPQRNTDGSTSWYRKWLTTQVTEADSYGAPSQVTTWEYVGGAAWHSDDDPLAPAAEQSWSDYRGYQKVLVREGTGATQTTDEYRYLRGMDGDHLADGTRRTVTLYTADSADVDSNRRAYQDFPWMGGELIEHRTLRTDGSELSAEQYDYSSFVVNDGSAGPFGIHHHKVVQVGTSYDIQMLKQGSTIRGRKHATYRTFEHGWGRQISEEDGGAEYGAAGTTSCAYTVYPGWDAGWDTWVPNLDKWIIDAPRQELSHAGDCSSDFRQRPAGALNGRSDLYYAADWSSLTTVPDTNNVTKTVDWSDASTAAQYTGTRYDTQGRVTGTIAPDNFITSATTFATAGPPSTIASTYTNGLVSQTVETDPAGNTATTVLDPGRGQPTSVTDLNGRTVTVGYDPLGRTLRVRQPGDTYDAETITYSLSKTAPSSVRSDSFTGAGATAISSWTFLDSLGRTYQSQSKSSTGAQVVAGTRYDNQGNPAAEVAAFAGTGTAGTVVPSWYGTTLTNQIPSTTVTSYDDTGRETSTALIAAGPSTVWTSTTSYDGQSTTSNAPANTGASEPNVAPVTVTMDDYEHVLSRIQGGVGTTYTYDISGNLTKEKSPSGAEITHQYNWLGQRTSTTDPDAGTSTADYYPSGLLKHSRDANGQDLFTSIDVLDRPKATYTGTSTAGTKLSETIYDGIPLGATTALKGTVTSQTSYTGGNAYTQKFAYDQRYRTTRADQIIPTVTGTPVASMAGTYTTNTTYDGMDRPTAITYPAVGGLAAETVTTGYSGAFATTLSGTFGGTTAYVSSTTYTGRGEVAARVLGAAGATGSVQRTNTFDAPTGRLTRQAAVTPSSGSTANVQNDTYTYTPAGQISKVTDAIAAQQQCYTYDARNRLTAALTSSSAGTPGTKTGNACAADSTAPTPYSEAYAYDDDGNLTSLTHNAVASTYGYGTNAARSLTGGPHAPTTLTKAGAVSTYTYDNAGQLKKKVVGTTTSTFAWDAQQTLASTVDTTTGTGAGVRTSTFTTGPDGSRWVRQTPTETVLYLAGQELHLAAAAATPTASRYYSHAGATVAVRNTGTGLSWMLGDGQGSATIAVAASTGVISRDRYLPYGGNRTSTFTLPTDRGWLGQTQDKDTGLHYLNARYYDPTLAHFISTDPLTDRSSEQTANAYVYGANNPISFTDPTGLRITGCDCNPRLDPARGHTLKKNKKGRMVWTPPRKKVADRRELTAAELKKAKSNSKPKAKAKPTKFKKAVHAVKRFLTPRNDCGDQCHQFDNAILMYISEGRARGEVPRGADGKFVKRNGQTGRAGHVDEGVAWDTLELDGLTTVRKETPVNNRIAPIRKYDGTVQINGEWYGVETKGGTARRDKNQREFDEWLNKPGNTVQTKDGRTLVGVFDVSVEELVRNIPPIPN